MDKQSSERWIRVRHFGEQFNVSLHRHADPQPVYRQAYALGAGAYVKKPYTLETLGLAVKAELEKTDF